MAKSTSHVAAIGEILFMAAARPLNGQYSIKLRILDNAEGATELKKHMLEVSPKKINTETNRDLNGEFVISFSSPFAPGVYGPDGKKLESREIPFFDGRKDSGTALVTYKVVNYKGKQLVRLKNIKLISLNLADRENEGKTTIELRDELRNIR